MKVTLSIQIVHLKTVKCIIDKDSSGYFEVIDSESGGRREEVVLVSGCFCVQCSVALPRRG